MINFGHRIIDLGPGTHPKMVSGWSPMVPRWFPDVPKKSKKITPFEYAFFNFSNPYFDIFGIKIQSTGLETHLKLERTMSSPDPVIFSFWVLHQAEL